MSLTKTVGFFAGTTLAIGGAAFGADQNSELAAEVANLKAQIAEMKNSQGDAWLTEQRASEIRGIVTDVLADAFVSKDMGGGLSFTVGQFKLPFSGEYGTDAGNLQFNDYSTISNAFADGYGQGLMLSYSADAFRAAVAYVNALNQVDADWGAGSPSDEFALTGRAEFKLSGTWDQFNNAMSFRGEEMGVLIGAGVNWADSNTAGNGDVFGATVDVTVDFGGANVMGAFYWDNNDDAPAGAENPYGFTLQGGVFVSDDVELVARYEYGDLDTNLDSNDFSTLTFGANWYMAQNTAKLGVNFGYAFDGIGIWEFPASGNNWLADGAGEDGQWMLQAQMSFSF